MKKSMYDNFCKRMT